MAPRRQNYSVMPRAFDGKLTPDGFSAQWSHPNEVFSVLLILGADVVLRALAQLAGGAITPVTFSFGEQFVHLTIAVLAMGATCHLTTWVTVPASLTPAYTLLRQDSRN